jgi:phage recombination protein Bet
MTVPNETALATRRDISREQVELLKRTICQGATDDELSMFVQTAERLHLDPFARQVFAVKRWDGRARREVMAIQVSIDGFRLVAERTGKYAGQLGPFWSSDGKEWLEVWLGKEPPAAAKVGVLRHDFKEPVWSVATWEQYKQTTKEGGVTSMWAKMGPLMLAKCAESLALRRAFPNELSGVYSQEEMAQAAEAEYTPPKSPPAPRANTVKASGQKASAEAVKLLHTLRAKVGGLVVCDPKTPCPYPNGKLCGYHTQLAAFKDTDGKPVRSSKDLSPEQIANLIGRYEKKIQEQGARAESAVTDIRSAVREPGSDDEPTEAAMAITAALSKSQMDADELCSIFGIDDVIQLDEDDASKALALVLAYGTSSYSRILSEVTGAPQ